VHEQLTVDPDIGKQAYEHARNRLGFEYDRFHLATEQRLSMITIGTIGQLVFKKYLESNTVPFEFQLQYGKYDDYDFKIQDKIVEVKSSGYKNPDEWMKLNGIYNASQLEHAILKNYFCSVQIFLNGYDKVNKLFNIAKCETAIIAGWLEIEEIAKTDPKYLPHGKAHLIPLSQLKDIKTLIGFDSIS
jgi:hypothetical protein